jgi:hypothetical protein
VEATPYVPETLARQLHRVARDLAQVPGYEEEAEELRDIVGRVTGRKVEHGVAEDRTPGDVLAEDDRERR